MANCAKPLHLFWTGRYTEKGAKEYIVRSNKTDFIEYERFGKEISIPMPTYDLKTDTFVNNKWVRHEIIRAYNYDYIEVPCGHCEICKANQAKAKAERAMCEAASHEHNEVINLTYDDEHMPRNKDGKGILNYKDVQLFKKRLIKLWKQKYGQEKIRFMCACEYGEKYARPHYHMIMFNFEAPEKYFWGYTKKGSIEYRDKLIEECWGKGNVTLGEVTPATIQYVANYCVKKFKGKKAKKKYEELGIVPESVKSSNRKGLGADFYETHKELYKEQGKCFLGTENGLKTIHCNKYFDKQLANEYGDEILKQIKEKRQKQAEQAEYTRAKLSGQSIEQQRKNDENAFLERVGKMKKRNF